MNLLAIKMGHYYSEILRKSVSESRVVITFLILLKNERKTFIVAEHTQINLLNFFH